MKHISTNLKTTKNRIMRRVWYSYIISIVSNSVAGAGIVFGASLVLFFKLVSVQNVLLNLLEVRLGAVPEYVWQVLVNTAINGGLLKIVSLGLIVASLLYLRKLVRDISFGPQVMRSV